jgi:1-acyl-sn-glycerol-3-phosphate acyltransferase
MIPLFYPIATTTMKFLLLVFSRWEVKGRENVPKTGPLIVVSNHLNLADPPLLSASIPRKIIFMVKQELYSSHRGGLFVRSFEAFPARRGELDLRAVRQAIRISESGKVLGMFPEGTRSPNAQMGPAEAGVSFIALHSKSPILPVGISGTEKIKSVKKVVFGHPQITVNIGKPLTLPFNRKRGKKEIAKSTNLIMTRIAELLPPAYRGIYLKKDRNGELISKAKRDI